MTRTRVWIGQAARALVAVAVVMMLTGCVTRYATPGAAANFADLGLSVSVEGMDASARKQLTDDDIQRRLALKPLASFPAHVAFAHIQDGRYRAYRTNTYGRGKVALVTTRDEESIEKLEALSVLPGVEGMAPINRMLVSDDVEHERQLREAAASVHADMLLLYTFDTVFEDNELIPHLGFLTLGLFPDREQQVTVTASAVLVDVRNGYVYGLAEGSADQDQLSNFWTSSEAVDDARRKAEREALGRLVENMKGMWNGVLQQHAPHLATEVEVEEETATAG